VDGAMQEYIVHPLHLLMPLPDTVDDGAAVMLEPMAIALHAVNLSNIRQGNTVLILGAGVLGSCVLELLKMHEDVRVLCVDPVSDRLDLALAAGADGAFSYAYADSDRHPSHFTGFIEDIWETAGAPGVDHVFECAGNTHSLWHMVEASAPGAQVTVIGSQPEDRVAFSSGSARRKGLTIRFVRRSLNTLLPCIHMAQEGAISPGRMVTHIFSASDTAKAYATVDRYADGVIKALIDMERL